MKTYHLLAAFPSLSSLFPSCISFIRICFWRTQIKIMTQERNFQSGSCPCQALSATLSVTGPETYRLAPLGPKLCIASHWTDSTPEARGGGLEDQPHVQGAVAAPAQEGLEELSHVEGQEGRR